MKVPGFLSSVLVLTLLCSAVSAVERCPKGFECAENAGSIGKEAVCDAYCKSTYDSTANGLLSFNIDCSGGTAGTDVCCKCNTFTGPVKCGAGSNVCLADRGGGVSVQSCFDFCDRVFGKGNYNSVYSGERDCSAYGNGTEDLCCECGGWNVQPCRKGYKCAVDIEYGSTDASKICERYCMKKFNTYITSYYSLDCNLTTFTSDACCACYKFDATCMGGYGCTPMPTGGDTQEVCDGYCGDRYGGNSRSSEWYYAKCDVGNPNGYGACCKCSFAPPCPQPGAVCVPDDGGSGTPKERCDSFCQSKFDNPNALSHASSAMDCTYQTASSNDLCCVCEEPTPCGSGACVPDDGGSGTPEERCGRYCQQKYNNPYAVSRSSSVKDCTYRTVSTNDLCCLCDAPKPCPVASGVSCAPDDGSGDASAICADHCRKVYGINSAPYKPTSQDCSLTTASDKDACCDCKIYEDCPADYACLPNEGYGTASCLDYCRGKYGNVLGIQDYPDDCNRTTEGLDACCKCIRIPGSEKCENVLPGSKCYYKMSGLDASRNCQIYCRQEGREYEASADADCYSMVVVSSSGQSGVCCRCRGDTTTTQPTTTWETTTTWAPTTTTTLPGTAALSVTSDPSGATVFLGGREQGITPLHAVNIAPGKYQLKVTLPGYRDALKKVTMVRGRTTSANVKLAPIPVGGLSVASVPDGATVLLNGGEKGVTPLSLSNIAAKRYTLQLTKAGYKNYKKAVVVKNGQLTEVNAKLRPIK